MSFIPVPNIAEAVLKYTRNGQQIRTVLHFAKGDSSDFTGAELLVLANGINAAWTAHLAAIFDVATVYNGVTVQDLTTDTSAGVDVPKTADNVGTVTAGVALPNSVVVAIKKLTGLRGRSFRGRIYQFGMTTNYLSDPGHISASTGADFLNQYGLFFAEIHALVGAFKHVVVSRYSGVANVVIRGRNKRQPIPRVSGIATAVTALDMDLILDSQRRRLPGRGL